MLKLNFNLSNLDSIKLTYGLQIKQRSIDYKEMECDDQVQPSTSAKQAGRPSKEFENMSKIAKRRATEDLCSSYNPAQLIFATRMSLRASGASKAANVLKEITTHSPDRAARYERALKSATFSCGTEISEDLALSDVVEGKMTYI